MSWRKHQITAELILVQVSGEKPMIPELFQLMIGYFRDSNGILPSFIEMIWPLHEKGIAGAEHPNPGVSNRCSFLFSGVKSPYPIDTVESWPTLSRRQKVEVRIMVKGKEAKLNIGSCGENGKSTWAVESRLTWWCFWDESERFERRKLLMLIFCSEVSF